LIKPFTNTLALHSNMSFFVTYAYMYVGTQTERSANQIKSDFVTENDGGFQKVAGMIYEVKWASSLK
jgi:hypothetical protein